MAERTHSFCACAVVRMHSMIVLPVLEPEELLVRMGLGRICVTPLVFFGILDVYSIFDTN